MPEYGLSHVIIIIVNKCNATEICDSFINQPTRRSATPSSTSRHGAPRLLHQPADTENFDSFTNQYATEQCTF
jgi:hypothetical protein